MCCFCANLLPLIFISSTERSLERNFLKHVLPQTMNVVYAGAYTPEQFKGFENAYKKRVLPPKEQQRKSQLKGSSGSGFALQIGDAIHEARHSTLVLPRASHPHAGTCNVPGVAVGPC
jgi:hypothetical protein